MASGSPGDSLPRNARTIINAESSASFSQHMTEIRGNHSTTSHVVRASAANQYDEPGPAEARAVDKVLRLPKLDQ